MRIVCLASGGIDSSVLLFMLKKDGHDIIPLHVNYGQKAANMELQSLNNICDFLELSPKIIDVSGLGVIPSGLTDPHISVHDSLFPARNLVFLTIAASYAITRSIAVISIGILANSIFSDQRVDFLKNSEETISLAIGTQMTILTPFVELNKREIIKIAKKYNFPLNLTYSCYAGSSKPCEDCPSCKERILVEKLEDLRV